MVPREVDEENLVAVEKAVRNLLSSSRGKRPEDILNNPDALADYFADAYLVVRSIEPDDNARFLQICHILSTKTGRSAVAAHVKSQFGARMIEA